MRVPVHRVCSCRDDAGRKLGKRCPQLANPRHGTWQFVADLPKVGKKRRQLRRGGYPTKAAALAALDDVRERIKQGVKVDDQQTVAEYLDAWLASKVRLRATTRWSYEYAINLWKPRLGHIRLEHLRHEHIAVAVGQLFAEAEERGRPITPSTVARFLAVLRSAMGTAVKTRRLPHNPAAHIELPEYEREEIRPWSAAETDRFLDAIQSERMAAFYELMLLEGPRRGELCGLRWADLDLGAGTMRIRHNRVEAAGRVVENAPKTRAGERLVELGARSVEVLLGWRMRQEIERAELGPAWTDTGHVFTREDGLPLRPENVSREFKRLTAAAGLRPIRLHDLRHLSASLGIAAGVRPEIISKRLGHSSTRITTDLYGHLLEGVGRAASDAGAALIQRARDARVTAETEQRAHPEGGPAGHDGAACRNRTDDLFITSESLCRLS